jgi:hypothetical protein
MASFIMAEGSCMFSSPKTKWTKIREVKVVTIPGPTPPSAAATTTAGEKMRYGTVARAQGNIQRM